MRTMTKKPSRLCPQKKSALCNEPQQVAQAGEDHTHLLDKTHPSTRQELLTGGKDAWWSLEKTETTEGEPQEASRCRNYKI
jgi:hypothetical protein